MCGLRKKLLPRQAGIEFVGKVGSERNINKIKYKIKQSQSWDMVPTSGDPTKPVEQPPTK